jgi:hypothetical protein
MRENRSNRVSESLDYYHGMATEAVDFGAEPEGDGAILDDAADRMLVAMVPRVGARRLYERAKLLYEATPQYAGDPLSGPDSGGEVQSDRQRQEEARRRNREGVTSPRKESAYEHARRLLGG